MSNRPIDRIDLDVETLQVERDVSWRAVVVRVNSVDLRALVMDARRPRLTAEHAAGRRGSGSLDELLDPELHDAFLPLRDVAPPSTHWLGNPDPDYLEDDRAAVLTCACGIFGCGGVTARITFHDAIVTWGDFTEANYGDAIPLRTFRFDRALYEGELNRLESAGPEQ